MINLGKFDCLSYKKYVSIFWGQLIILESIMKKITSLVLSSYVLGSALFIASAAAQAVTAPAPSAAPAAQQSETTTKKAIAATGKIAVVDIQKVIQSAPQMKVIQKKLETNFKERRAKLVSLESTLKADMDKFKRESSVLSEKQKKESEKAIITKQQSLQRDGEKYQQDLSAYQNELMEDFYNNIRKTIKAVAEKNQYEVVLQKDAAPYSIAQLDITAQVLQALKN
jgi:outer membrane protein